MIPTTVEKQILSCQRRYEVKHGLEIRYWPKEAKLFIDDRSGGAVFRHPDMPFEKVHVGTLLRTSMHGPVEVYGCSGGGVPAGVGVGMSFWFEYEGASEVEVLIAFVDREAWMKSED